MMDKNNVYNIIFYLKKRLLLKRTKNQGVDQVTQLILFSFNSRKNFAQYQYDFLLISKNCNLLWEFAESLYLFINKNLPESITYSICKIICFLLLPLTVLFYTVYVFLAEQQDVSSLTILVHVFAARFFYQSCSCQRNSEVPEVQILERFVSFSAIRKCSFIDHLFILS